MLHKKLPKEREGGLRQHVHTGQMQQKNNGSSR